MTAEIGILNKSAVVIAADSAVTIGAGRKVFNTANKIFKLSDEEAVGIMVYNSANWMDIPLELIIKMYRDSSKREFHQLSDYVDDFIRYLNEEFVKHVSDEKRLEFISLRLSEIIDDLIESANAIINELIQSNDIERPTSEAEERVLFETYFINHANEIIKYLKSESIDNNLKGYSLTKFKKEYISSVSGIIKGFVSAEKLKDGKKITDTLIHFLYLELVSNFSPEDDYSGLVFAGYGKDEIFPSIYEIRFAGIIGGIVKLQKFGDGIIDEDNSAIVAPFAQREMVDTFMEGVDPSLMLKIKDEMASQFKIIQQKLTAKYKIKDDFLNKLLTEAIVNIDKSIKEFQQINHVEPIVLTMSFLRKEDLIEIAESLVGITSLKRKATMEVETVGGPIDIAIITKGEGFVWVKRKEKLIGF